MHGVARDLGLAGGFIVRTAGEGRATAEFLPEARTLAATWDDVRRRAVRAAVPVSAAPGILAVAKVLRDVPGEDVQRDGDCARTARRRTSSQVAASVRASGRNSAVARPSPAVAHDESARQPQVAGHAVHQFLKPLALGRILDPAAR